MEGVIEADDSDVAGWSGAGPYLRVLGAVAVVLPGGVEVALSRIQRVICARLLLAAPQPALWTDLAGAVWGREQPASARAAIQNQISRVRAAAGEDVIVTAGEGYALGIDTDVALLSAATRTVQEALVLAPDWAGRCDASSPGALSLNGAAGGLSPVDMAVATLEQLVPTGRPEVLGDLGGGDAVTDYRSHAETVLVAARSVRLGAALRAGRWAWALVEGERLHAETPLDEQVAAHYARALALAGRRSQALSVIAEVRRMLRLQLGVDSGPYLDTAERDILHGRAGAALVGRGGASAVVMSPLVGRSDELRRILQAVAQRHPVRVRGEHGSGVSRMLFETRARLSALRVRTVLVRAEEHPHSATSVLEELLVEVGAPEDATLNAISKLVAFANSIDADHPTVFIVDDVQFLGPSAWQALRAVSEAEFGGLVLGGHGHVVELDGEVEILLGPLDTDGIGAVARHSGVTDSDSIQRIVESAGGNPMAAFLLATSLRERPPGAVDSASAVNLPVFADFLQQLVGELGAEQRHDLQLAAVAGDGYPDGAFDHIPWGHRPRPPASLVEVDDDGLLRFRHGAVQSYVYRTLPRGVLLDMHYALGLAAREIDAPAGTVARHLLAAAELDPSAAIDAARAAAREATLLGAHADAAGWLAQARNVLDGDGDGDGGAASGGAVAGGRAPDRLGIALAVEHADALRLSGDPSHLDALVAATRSALACGDENLIAAAGFALLQLGGSSPAGDLNDDLSTLARDVIDAISDPQLRAPVQAAASLAWSMTGHADEARALFDEAEATATTVPARLAVLPFAYLAVGRPGDVDRRAALAEELVTLSRAADQPVPLWEGLHLTFTVALQRGGGALLRETLQEMESLIGRVGDVGRRWSTQYCAATVAYLDGDLARCEQLTGQAYATFAPVSPDRAATAYYGQLMPLRLDQGRLAELRPVAMAMVTEQPGVTAWHAVAALVLAADSSGPGAGDAAQAARAGGAAPDAGSDGPVDSHRSTDAAHGGAADDLALARTHAECALDLAQDDFLWLAAHVVGGRAAAMLRDRDLIDRYTERLAPWADLVCWQGTCSYGPVADVLKLLADARGDTESARSYQARAAALRAALARR